MSAQETNRSIEDRVPTRGQVVLEGVRKSFAGREILHGVSLNVEPGQVVVLMGPSGSGKSTLLRTINHLEAQDAGRVTIDGQMIGYQPEGQALRELPEREVLRRRAQVGMVFQQFNLFPHMTVEQNIIEAPVHAQGRPRAEARRTAQALLDRVGLGDRGGAFPRQLSGGQQQRVAIARAMALHPKVLLFDEPTSALDPELVEEVLEVIRGLADEGVTLIVVTHEMSFAREVADHVVFMADGEIVEQGPPQKLFSAPQHARTREFLGRHLDPEYVL
ncbi:amino acid ABC transporter ATP-binding protein [Kocuria palustris]|uniref:amino acid ABC transporter ATP-binding protein n=1 Tax=Kocuria palustris TaxID=71999 RepID=UPI000A91A725|nr:amino acid ABC transporter ATP-binding protein [Kocuria palustris]